MRALNFCGHALSIGIAAAILAACSGSPLTPSQGHAPIIGVDSSLAPQPRSSVNYKTLYSFQGGTDGAGPSAALTAMSGVLYGTTGHGGSGPCYEWGHNIGCGIVFAMTTSGSERIIHTFKGGSDGAGPEAFLINVGGVLYGETGVGGGFGCNVGCGTVFSVSSSGLERVLHSFTGGADGAYPEVGLINVNGAVYGTTFEGGANNLGTVFTLSTSGSERLLYSFKGGTDGAYPRTNLIAMGGILYGTTSQGGSGCSSPGCGTVFSVSTSGSERVLYSFKGGADGARPSAGLVNVGGVLYGTTYMFGDCQFCGTIFSVTTLGVERVLYNFKGGSDGAEPEGSLLKVNGALYGTTFGGGTSSLGTVFKVSTSGAERVIYSFKVKPDGNNPEAGLIEFKRRLYGTSGYGGTNDGGTVYSLSP